MHQNRQITSYSDWWMVEHRNEGPPHSDQTLCFTLHIRYSYHRSSHGLCKHFLRGKQPLTLASQACKGGGCPMEQQQQPIALCLYWKAAKMDFINIHWAEYRKQYNLPTILTWAISNLTAYSEMQREMTRLFMFYEIIQMECYFQSTKPPSTKKQTNQFKTF